MGGPDRVQPERRRLGSIEARYGCLARQRRQRGLRTGQLRLGVGQRHAGGGGVGVGGQGVRLRGLTDAETAGQVGGERLRGLQAAPGRIPAVGAERGLGRRVEHLKRQRQMRGLGLGPQAGDLRPCGVLRRPPLARQPDGSAQFGLMRDVVLVAARLVVNVGAGHVGRIREKGAPGSDSGGGGLTACLQPGAVRQPVPRRLHGVMQGRRPGGCLGKRGQGSQQENHGAPERAPG